MANDISSAEKMYDNKDRIWLDRDRNSDVRV